MRLKGQFFWVFYEKISQTQKEHKVYKQTKTKKVAF